MVSILAIGLSDLTYGLLEYALRVGEKICEALGLDPRAVESLNIDVESKYLVVHAKLMYFAPEKIDKVIEVIVDGKRIK